MTEAVHDGSPGIVQVLRLGQSTKIRIVQEQPGRGQGSSSDVQGSLRVVKGDVVRVQGVPPTGGYFARLTLSELISSLAK